MELPFWFAMDEIIEREKMPLNSIIAHINRSRHSEANLTSAVRVFIHGYFFALAHRRKSGA